MEVEAKLLAPGAETLDAIAAARRLDGFRLTSGGDETLETTYLDTADRRLLRSRIAFRLRRTPRGYELTVKLPGEVSGDVHRRPEWTWRRARPPRFPFSPASPEIRALLGRFTGGASLLPLVATRVRRRTMLARKAGRSAVIAEVALDEVELRRVRRGRAGTGSSRYFEVEIELRRGAEQDVARLARALRAQYRLRPSRRSKLERALRWAGISTRSVRHRPALT